MKEWSNHYLQVHGAFAASLAEWKLLSGPQQTYSFGLASLASLSNISDPKNAMVTSLSEGFPFRGGRRLKNSSNVEISDIIWMCSRKPLVWGVEWELPIETVDGKCDYKAIQRAW